MTTIALPDASFSAGVTVPGDKSLGHRALVMAAMAEGTSQISGLSDGADIASTAGVLAELGVEIGGGTVTSPGFLGWAPPERPLDCGNSGTTMRLMAGALSPASFGTTLIGDDSLSRRPMRRLVEPLGALGAVVATTPGGTAPLRIEGRPLRGAEVEIPIPSAQVRTAVALAALHAVGPTLLDSPPGFRDHTERWLVSLGRAERLGPTRLRVDPGPIPPLDLVVPGDPSSAAFLWAVAAVRPGSTVTTHGVSLNEGRLGFLRILADMGARVEVEVSGQVLGDLVGEVSVTGAQLRGISVSPAEVASSVDELPLVAVVAAAAAGETRVEGASELRAKESDRLAGAVALARLAGAAARVEGDGFVVGVGERAASDRIDAAGDHRIAMAAAVAAAVRREPISIAGFEVCVVSWPGFRTALEGLWS